MKYAICTIPGQREPADGVWTPFGWLTSRCRLALSFREKAQTRLGPGQTSRLVMNETDYAGSLDEPRTGGRGQLRIYLGSAAGVGKSFAMLGEGYRRAGLGTVIVGALS